MRINIIGSGNVATVLGKALLRAGHTINQVIGRNRQNAEKLASTLNCSYTCDDKMADMNAELFLFAVSDAALYDIGNRFSLGNKIALHTAGSVPKDVLKNISANYGVFYPLQSLRKEMDVIPEMPLMVDGNSPELTEMIVTLANSISPVVSITNDEDRLHLHVAAVIVSNFTNHLYALAENFCSDEKIDFKLLLPLINETAERLQLRSATELQTGPALRNDFVTLDKHMKILLGYPKLRSIYIKMTDSIMSV